MSLQRCVRGGGFPQGRAQRGVYAQPPGFSLCPPYSWRKTSFWRAPPHPHTRAQVSRTRSQETMWARSPRGSSRVGMQTSPGSSQDFTITKTPVASAILWPSGKHNTNVTAPIQKYRDPPPSPKEAGSPRASYGFAVPGLPKPGAGRGITGALHGGKSYHRGTFWWGEEGDHTDKDKKKKKNQSI